MEKLFYKLIKRATTARKLSNRLSKSTKLSKEFESFTQSGKSIAYLEVALIIKKELEKHGINVGT